MSSDLVVRAAALRFPEAHARPTPRLARGTIAPAFGTTPTIARSPRVERVRIEPEVIDDAEVMGSVAMLQTTVGERMEQTSKRDVHLFAPPLEASRARRVTAAYAAAAPELPRPFISVG